MIKTMFLYFKSKIPKSVLFFLTLLYHSLSYIFLKIRYPKLKYFKNFPSNFSQAGQDEIIYNHFFYGMYKGFFCDVGSNDPIVLSNTYFFEKLGWTGIAFDPQSNLVQQWRKLRTCQFFPLALSDEVKYVKFRLVNDHVGWENMLSFIEDTNKENLDYSDSILDIQTSTLKKELDSLSVENIDFLSIDVEGHELEVIKGIDFNKVRINVILIENNPSGNRVFGKSNIRSFLSSKGFLFYGRIHALDDIFVFHEYVPSKNKNFRKYSIYR